MNTNELIEYCDCSIYMSNGEGRCLFCNKPMRPIKIKKLKGGSK
jgi:hypothetical protein